MSFYQDSEDSQRDNENLKTNMCCLKYSATHQSLHFHHMTIMINLTGVVDLSDINTTIFSEDSTNEDESSNSTIISIYFLLFSILMVAAIIGSKLLHDRPSVSAILPEAGMIIAIGIVAGVIVQFTFTSTASQQEVAKSLVTFSPDVFFVALLPPIICT